MINHARTLLLNLPAGSGEPAMPGFAPVAPGFQPVQLAGNLEAFRSAMLGSDPDTEGLLWTAAQYLDIVHGSPWADYLLAHDSRLTYVPGRLSGRLVPALSATAFPGAAELAFASAVEHPAGTGRARLRWELEALDSSTLAVELCGKPVADMQLVFSGSRSLPARLPGVAAGSVAVAASSLVPGWRWSLESVAPPSGTPASRVAAALRNGSAVSEVFAGAGEPWRTFLALARVEDDPYAKVAGAVLGLVYRMEALRRG